MAKKVKPATLVRRFEYCSNCKKLVTTKTFSADRHVWVTPMSSRFNARSGCCHTYLLTVDEVLREGKRAFDPSTYLQAPVVFNPPDPPHRTLRASYGARGWRKYESGGRKMFHDAENEVIDLMAATIRPMREEYMKKGGTEAEVDERLLSALRTTPNPPPGWNADDHAEETVRRAKQEPGAEAPADPAETAHPDPTPGEPSQGPRKLSADDALWEAILDRDEDLKVLRNAEVIDHLTEGGFPDSLVKRYLERRRKSEPPLFRRFREVLQESSWRPTDEEIDTLFAVVRNKEDKEAHDGGAESGT